MAKPHMPMSRVRVLLIALSGDPDGRRVSGHAHARRRRRRSTRPRRSRTRAARDLPAPRPGPSGPLEGPDAGRVRPRLPDVLHPVPGRHRVRLRVQRDALGELRFAQRGPGRGRGRHLQRRRLRDPEGRRGGRLGAGRPREHPQVEIYRAKSERRRLRHDHADRLDPSGTATLCTLPDGTATSVPYTRTNNLYPEASRCNILAGCPGPGSHTTIDHIGVRIFYDHQYVTPLETFVGTGDGFVFDRSNVMRMEPIL